MEKEKKEDGVIEENNAPAEKGTDNQGTEGDKKPDGATDEKPGETPKEKTIGDIIQDAGGQKPAEKQPETVGLDKYVKEKQKRQVAEDRIKELEATIAGGASQREVSADIKAIAEEFGVEEGFLNKLANVFEQRAEEKVRPILEKEKAAKIDAAFREHFAIAIESMPEYKDVVNADVIKSLSLDPKNSKKTLPQIIEETYGNALTGKRTIETGKPGGGKEPATLDYARAQKDTSYFKEVMANPKLKKEYNERMMQEGF